MTQLTAVDATPENFKDFGVLLTRPDREPDLVAPDDYLYWDSEVWYGRTLQFANLGILHVQRVDPLICSILEVQPDGRESYFCLDGAQAVIVVAKGSACEPDLSTAQAFKLNGHSVVVGPGIWHYHPLPTEADSTYALVNSGDVLYRNRGEVAADSRLVTVLTLDEPIQIDLG